MITKPAPPADWRLALRQAYRDPQTLLADLAIAPERRPKLLPPTADFRFMVTREFASRMRQGDPADPLLRQVLPLAEESGRPPGFSADPVGEQALQDGAGLIQKYAGRALLITTGACAIHCRYCFRREFPYASAHASGGQWNQALQALAADPSIKEAILSGGDPLSLDNEALARILTDLGRIPHLRSVRIHSRQPIVLPQRVDAELGRVLAHSPHPVVMVLHSNHANEINHTVKESTAVLRDACHSLLNQSVLLRGVNDAVTALTDLSEALFAAGVAPYYLHQLDPVAGAHHFAVPDADAAALLRAVNARLPGYLVPRLVREIPGESGKLPVNWSNPS